MMTQSKYDLDSLTEEEKDRLWVDTLFRIAHEIGQAEFKGRDDLIQRVTKEIGRDLYQEAHEQAEKSAIERETRLANESPKMKAFRARRQARKEARDRVLRRNKAACG